MHWVFWLLIICGSFIFMEVITWFTHKYVMHGFLWYLHQDHHHSQGHFFEKNDFFFLIFAVPSWLSIMLGLYYQYYIIAAIGFGIALYGAAYFLIHEVIIHQRIRWFTRSNNTYIKAIRWAHKMHHKHKGKEGGESFGLLVVAKKHWDKVKKDKSISVKNINI